MSDGNLKPEKDYSHELDERLPSIEALANHDLQAALDQLLVLEKQTRPASDLASTTRVLVTIVTICKQGHKWKLLNEQVQALARKHGQLKQAVTKMVQVVMTFVDQTPDLDTKLSLIEALRVVTEGKIFVEVERARITKVLSDIKKAQGDVKAARDVLCELQVETFGSMSRREKTEFILQQVQLCIDTEDYTQAGILSRKIGTKYFTRKPKKTSEQLGIEAKEREEKEKNRSVDDPPIEVEDDVSDLKLRYYYQQITLSQQDDKYLDVCKNYRHVLDTESVEDDPAKLTYILSRVIYYIVLAPYDNEQSDLLHRIHLDKRNTQIPLDSELLKSFTIPELMRWPIIDQHFGPHLCNSDVFEAQAHASPDKKAYQRWEDLRRRAIEHNLRVIAKYYTRIRYHRLCELLDLEEKEMEKYLSELVTKKTVYARIDRPARVVSFVKKRGEDEVLNEWSADMKSLLGVLERIDHLITKEEMMARISGQTNLKDKTAGVSAV